MKASNREMLLVIAGFIGGHVVTIGLNLLKQKQAETTLRLMEAKQKQLSSEARPLDSGYGLRKLNNISYDNENEIFIESF